MIVLKHSTARIRARTAGGFTEENRLGGGLKEYIVFLWRKYGVE